MRPDEIGEFGLVERWSKGLPTRSKTLLGIGDDAAVLAPLQQPVVTVDALIETIHFRRDWTTARDLGWKAIAVNLSDIAAMGALPVAAFVALGLPDSVEVAWLDELYGGIEEAAAAYDLTIAGGDTTRSPSALMISVTLIGEVPLGRSPLRRDGARSGDIVLATGTLGDAAAGLQLLLNPHIDLDASTRDYLMASHHRPQPRLKAVHAALAAAPHGISAALDLSDGLAGDAAHIARCSGVTLEIDTAQLPISPQCRAAAAILNQDAEQWALRGGEDYELLLCAAPDVVPGLVAAVEQSGVALTPIGRCLPLETSPVMLLHSDGRREIARPAWTHF